MFTREARKNILETGNVWGHTEEYVYRFTVPLPFGLEATFKQEPKDAFMGRFGGGWKYEFGVMVGGTTVIIMLFVMSIRISPKKESK